LSKTPPPARVRRITETHSSEKSEVPQSKMTEFSIKNLLT
jgi:hypothetical protein